MPAKYSYGKSKDKMSNQQWFRSGMSTHGSAYLFNRSNSNGLSLGIMKNNRSKRHGCEHAEDVFIRYIKENVGLLRTSPSVNTIVLSISKSPCSSTHGTSNKPKGCAEELIDFQNNPYHCPITGNQYIFKLIVIARALYKQSSGSRKALTMMKLNGIEVTTDVHRKKDGTSMAKEY